MASRAATTVPEAGTAAEATPRSAVATGAPFAVDASVASFAPASFLVAAALAWLAGVALQLQERTLLPWPTYAGGLLVGGLALVAGVAARLRPARRNGLSGIGGLRSRGAAVAGQAAAVIAWSVLSALAGVTALAAVAAIAFAVTGLRAADRLADALPAALEGRDLRVTGVVASLPQRNASGLRFRFDVESAALAGQPVALPRGLSLGWYKGFHEDAVLTQPQRELAAGQRWVFTLRLRQPHGNLNPHGFDGELLLFEQGLRAVGYVRDAPPPRLLEAAAAYPLERWRQHVRDAIESRIADPRIAGVLAALAVGDQSAIARDDWALFRDTGVAHLVSISGLHVTMFAWLAGAAITAGWRRSGRAMLWLPAPTAGRWGGLLAALGYALLSGFGVPAQRTVWMLAVVTVLRSGGLRWPWPLTLLAAAVVVTLLDPWALLQAGFWLSFMAVGLLMASAGADGRPAPHEAGALGADRSGGTSATRAATSTAGQADSTPRRLWQQRSLHWVGRGHAALRGGLRTQAMATIGLAPLTLVFFQQLSLVGFVANLVAIPLVTLLITPLALLGTLAGPLWIAGGWAIEALIAFLQWLQGWPGAVWWAPAAPAWAQLAGLAAAALAVAPLPWRLRALALPMALPLALPAPERPADGRFELLAVDVGQGTAVLVRTRRHLLVYDAGPRYSRDGDAGERVLLPLLRASGDRLIDRLVLSHRDSDHTGGAAALLRGLPVAALSTSIEPGHPLLVEAAARGIPAVRCAAGQHWRWDGVDFSVLAPPAAAAAVPLRSNASSCVLRVSARPDESAPPSGDTSALLTGDIESAQEAALVAEHGDRLRSAVLMVPHHGSKTSSTTAFVDAVAPRVAVVQAGYRNRFGHPAPEVLARYAAHGVALVTSVDCGAWRWRSPALPQPEQPPDAATASQAVERALAGPRANGVCERDRARRYWHHPLQPPAPP